MPASPRNRRVRPVPAPHGTTHPPQDAEEAVEEVRGERVPPGDHQPLPEVLNQGQPVPTGEGRFSLDVAGRDVGEVLAELRDDVTYWVQKGRYNKVRILRDGKPVLPDIPVGAILAVEAASMVWLGALRTVVVNLAGRLLFSVEMINDAQEHLVAARAHYDRGDLDEAEAEAVKALKVDSRLPDAFLFLGTCAKLRGKKDEALRHFTAAKDLDPHGPVGREADTQARRIDPSFGTKPTAEKA